MKYLVIFLWITTIEAASIRERVKALPDLRLAMHLCGYNDSNMEVFTQKLERDRDEARLGCLESKKAEVAALLSDDQSKAAGMQAARERMQALDCSSLSSQVLKDLCVLSK